MNIMNNTGQDWTSCSRLRRFRFFLIGSKVPDLRELSENLLWDCALGVLDSEEESLLLEWLANDDNARRCFRGICQSLREAGYPLAISDAFPEEGTKESDNRPEGESEGLILKGTIVDTPHGLEWCPETLIMSAWSYMIKSIPSCSPPECLDNGGERWSLSTGGFLFIPKPVMLDPSLSQGAVQQMILAGENGISVTFHRIAPGRIHLRVNVKDSEPGATVRLFWIEHGEESQLGTAVPLEEGEAEFLDVPPGVLRVVTSDNRELGFVLRITSEEADTNSSDL